jgi:DHA1 family bicyclomycin/chloramphenicol resistance-like MFS transporter
MVAPLLGAFLLQFTSWRGLFYIFFLAGCVALGLSFALKETLHHKSETPVWFFASRIVFVLRNTGFRSLLLLFSLTAMPFMAYLATSSFIFAAMFKTSTEAYSCFFAVNAFASMLGPMAYIRFLRRMPGALFLAVCFGVTSLCGVALLFWGSAGPFIFAALFLPVTFLGSACRPLGTVLMMSQLDTDNGAVASLMGSFALLFGSMSMLITSLAWPDPVIALGAVCLGAGALSFLLWLLVNHKPVYRKPKRYR